MSLDELLTPDEKRWLNSKETHKYYGVKSAAELVKTFCKRRIPSSNTSSTN